MRFDTRPTAEIEAAERRQVARRRPWAALPGVDPQTDQETGREAAQLLAIGLAVVIVAIGVLAIQLGLQGGRFALGLLDAYAWGRV